MILEALCPSLLEPHDWKFSASATALLRRLAPYSGDPLLTAWMSKNPGFDFDGICPGYTMRMPEGGIRIGINRRLLGSKIGRIRTKFVAAHELGHVRQLLRGEIEAPRFTRHLFSQEMDASDLAATILKKSGCRITIYRCRPYLLSMAAEAAFPVLSHGLWFCSIFGCTWWIFEHFSDWARFLLSERSGHTIPNK